MCTPPRELRGPGTPATGRPGDRWDADECVLLLVDHQEGLLGTIDTDRPDLLVDRVVALGAAACSGDVPVVATTLAHTGGCGPMLLRLQEAVPGCTSVERSVIDPWRERALVAALHDTGRPALVVAGSWTEVCVTPVVVAALWAGYRVAVVTDSCGGTSAEAHHSAIALMSRAGATPVTTAEVVRAWSNRVAAVPVVRAIPA